MNIFTIPRISSKKVFFALFLAFITFPFAQAAAQTYYVNNGSANASDSNPGTFDLPWLTIHKANRTVTAGDTVIVMPGVYHDWIFPDSCGTQDNWIVYKSEQDYAACLNGMVELNDALADGESWYPDDSYGGNVWKIKLISGAFYEAWKDSTRMPYPYPYPCDSLRFAEGRSFVDQSGYLFVWLPENDAPENHEWKVTLKSGVWLLSGIGSPDKYLIVEGFSVKNYGLAGITVEKNHVKILNNKSFSNGRAGIGVSFCNHVFVEGNEAYENCKWTGFSQGITAYGVTGKDIYFRRNISHDNFDGDDSQHCGTDGNGFVLDTAEPEGGAVFINNVAYRNQGGGFGVYQSNYGYFINNTSFNNGLKSRFASECHITGTGESSSNNLIFRNNIFAGRQNHPYVITIKYAYNRPPENVLLDHNLYYLPGVDSLSKIFEFTIGSALGDTPVTLNLREFQNLYFPSDTGNILLHWGKNSIVASPEFIDWENGGFKVNENSEAIDNGDSLYAPSIDYYGTLRPQGAGFDMGAYEYKNETGVENTPETNPLKLSSYPNPFNGQIRINYSLQRKSNVTLIIYDLLGREVAKLIDKKMPPGSYSEIWHASNSLNGNIASGVYIILLKTDFSFSTNKIIYLK